MAENLNFWSCIIYLYEILLQNYINSKLYGQYDYIL